MHDKEIIETGAFGYLILFLLLAFVFMKLKRLLLQKAGCFGLFLCLLSQGISERGNNE